jgi:hypothetical protein
MVVEVCEQRADVSLVLEVVLAEQWSMRRAENKGDVDVLLEG